MLAEHMAFSPALLFEYPVSWLAQEVAMSEAGRYSVKVYVVQQADADGKLSGEVIAAKLTHSAAHAIAKKHAPAKVTCLLADKGPEENGPDYTCDHQV